MGSHLAGTRHLILWNKTTRARKASSLRLKARMSDPHFKEKVANAVKQTWANTKLRNKMLSNLRNCDSAIQARRGSKSRNHENRVAKLLYKEYDQVFTPSAVCDRICIKNGRVFFIEIKQVGQQLRPKQEQFKQLVGNAFIIYYK